MAIADGSSTPATALPQVRFTITITIMIIVIMARRYEWTLDSPAKQLELAGQQFDWASGFATATVRVRACRTDFGPLALGIARGALFLAGIVPRTAVG